MITLITDGFHSLSGINFITILDPKNCDTEWSYSLFLENLKEMFLLYYIYSSLSYAYHVGYTIYARKADLPEVENAL